MQNDDLWLTADLLRDNQPARRIISVIAHNPEAVKEALAQQP
jgi:hypothetical protein